MSNVVRLAHRWFAPLYAQPAHRGISSLANARLFFLAAAVPLLLGLAICLTVIVIDPFDLRPWGPQPRFFDGNYPELVTPRLVRAVSREPEDVLLVGGSQAMGVTPAQLRRAFGATRVFNLAYSLMEARDLDVVARTAVRAPALKRLIVELPFTVMEWDRPPAPTGAGAVAVTGAPWYSFPDFGEDIARGSLERVSTGEFQTAEWRRQSARFLGPPGLLQNKPLLGSLESAFRRVPSKTFEAAPPLPCARFQVIRKVLLPLMAESALRGAELDLYFPPIPPQSYPRTEIEQATDNGSVFRQITSFHRCVIEAAAQAGRPNVHVLAIDLDQAIVGDLGNYKDTLHLERSRSFDRLLDDVRAHGFELRTRDSNAYVTKVSGLVLTAYRERNPLP